MQFSQNQNFCDTTILTNGAKLYYQWNCDSTWLTFENNEKVILKSCMESDPILCSRIGLNFIKEYPNYLLFRHRWISGCCTSPDLVFIDKRSGIEKERIKKDQFIWGDADENYALYFSDTTFTKLMYREHELDQMNKFLFKDSIVLNSLSVNNADQLNDILKNFKNEKGMFSCDFINENGEIEQIRIRLKY